MRRVLLCVAVLVGLCGCDQGQSTPSQATLTALPTATPDIRLTSAAAYLTALGAYHAQVGKVEGDVCAHATLVAGLRRCWTERLAAQQTFGAAIAAIAFPDDIRNEVQVLLAANARLAAAMHGIAVAADPAADLADKGVFTSASSDVLEQITIVRTDLGILPTASPAPS
jgi:hypothetical protein